MSFCKYKYILSYYQINITIYNDKDNIREDVLIAAPIGKEEPKGGADQSGPEE